MRALDEAKFGPARTLDLRAGRPGVAEALRRVEPWLRERQMAKAGDVLVITGRGHGSPGGVGAIRQHVEVLLKRLQRAGVVASTRQHAAGAFAVELAPITALFKISPRTRHPTPKPPTDPAGLAALDADTRRSLRLLAEYSLTHLGVPATGKFVEDEMLRQFSVLAAAMAPEETDREDRLRFMIAASMAAFEDDS